MGGTTRLWILEPELFWKENQTNWQLIDVSIPNSTSEPAASKGWNTSPVVVAVILLKVETDVTGIW